MADTEDQLNQEELDNLLNQIDTSDQGAAQSQEDIARIVEEEMRKMLEEESKQASTPQTLTPQTSQVASRAPARPPAHEEEVHLAQFPDLHEHQEQAVPQASIERLLDITLLVSAELGRVTMAIKEILELGEGSVVQLDTLAGDQIELLVNNKRFAKGEVVVVGDRFGIRITEVITPTDRLKNL